MAAIIAQTAAGGYTTLTELQYKEPTRSNQSEANRKSIHIPATKILNTSIRKGLESRARRANWYKYVAVAILGLIGVAALVAGFVLGYSWVLIGFGTVAILGSLYAAKRAKDQVKYAGGTYARGRAELSRQTAIGAQPNSLFDIRGSF